MLGRAPDRVRGVIAGLCGKPIRRTGAPIVMSYFGFRSVIIDNAIEPPDRKVFYALHDAGLLQSFWETMPLLDGRNWRIFYWSLNEADIDRILAEVPPPEETPLYKGLPDEAWGHSAPTA